MSGVINFFSLNIGTSSSLAGLPALVVSEKLNIIFLQEVRLSSEQLEPLLRGFKAVSNVDLENSSRPGTAIAWKENLPVENVVSLVDCRLQIASLGNLDLINVYAPSGSSKKQDRAQFYKKDVFQSLQLSDKKSYVLGGDFNAVLSILDIEGGIGFPSKKCDSLKKLVEAFNLIDPFREKFPFKKEFTFHRPGSSSSRLDKFYLSTRLLPQVPDICHCPSLSDHFGVKLTFHHQVEYIPSPPRKKSYWKLNNAILHEDSFSESFNTFWLSILKHRDSFKDIAEWWDLLAKPEIKKFCMAFAIQRKLERSHTKKFLMSWLKIETEEKRWSEVQRIKSRIRQMVEEDNVGFIVRSRTQENVNEEKATLYHAAREVKKTSMDKLKINGVISSSQDHIEAEVINFFSALLNGHHDVNLRDSGSPFSPDNTCLPEMLNGLPSLEADSSEALHCNVDVEEVEYVIGKCASNKAPGLDGLTYEFYKKTWLIIKNVFVAVLQCQLDRFRIVESNSTGATSLISKVGGVPSVGELRPITLLNCDYKILAKILVKRMRPVLPQVIKSGQLCSVGQRNIFMGVRNILSSILYINQKNSGGCLMSLDFFKAYDRVYVDFLIKVMESMGFSFRFCSWILMLHRGAKTRFILLSLSQPVDVSFSIRQGDPLAMILYIIYIEPLLIYIERRTSGLRIENFVQKDEAYCDDVNFLTEDVEDLKVVDDAVSKFEMVSGAILSRNNKCKVMGIGRWKDREEWPLHYLQTVKEIKVFGIFLSNSFKALLKKNWEYRVGKFIQIMAMWSSRGVKTLFQRVELVNVFALSRIFYVASVLPIPKYVIQRVEKHIGNFLWKSSGKLLRVSMAEIKNSTVKGGLGLLCLESMGKSLLLSQLLNPLKHGDKKSVNHLGYWIGEVLDELYPGLIHLIHPQTIPNYFASLAELVAEAVLSGTIDAQSWKKATNKMIYRQHARSFPQPKVALDSGSAYNDVWRNLNLSCLSLSDREILFLLIHNKLPVAERLYRIRIKHDPYCDECMRVQGAVVGDRWHFFLYCEQVHDVWNTIRKIINNLHPVGLKDVTDEDLIQLKFSKSKVNSETVWIIGKYLDEAWRSLYVEGSVKLSRDKVFGFLKFKYRQERTQFGLNIAELN